MRQIRNFLALLNSAALTVGTIVAILMILVLFSAFIFIFEPNPTELGGILETVRFMALNMPIISAVLLLCGVYAVIYFGWVKKV